MLLSDRWFTETDRIGTVLISLLEIYPTNEIIVLLRATNKDIPTKFKSLDVHTLTATSEEEVSSIAEGYDVVIHEAGASNIIWIKGLIAGLEKRANRTGSDDGEDRGENSLDNRRGRRKPIFMYGGGTGVLMDDCKGEYTTNKIWSVSRPFSLLDLW